MNFEFGEPTNLAKNHVVLCTIFVFVGQNLYAMPVKKKNKKQKTQQQLTLVSSCERQMYRKILDGTADLGWNHVGSPRCPPFYSLYLLHCGQGWKGGWMQGLTSLKY